MYHHAVMITVLVHSRHPIPSHKASYTPTLFAVLQSASSSCLGPYKPYRLVVPLYNHRFDTTATSTSGCTPPPMAPIPACWCLKFNWVALHCTAPLRPPLPPA